MTGWKARRFWTRAEAAPCEGGFTVLLDGKPVRTPGKAPFVLPTLALAQACTLEWDAQKGQVKPATMPMTRYANSALDKVAPQHSEVAAIVSAYGETDLLCYRAEGPEPLRSRQDRVWDPLLSWSGTAFDAPLRLTTGIVPIAQDSASLARLCATVTGLGPFELAALHDLVAITGSLIIGMAMARGHIDADAGFAASRIDEHWQAEQWGQDEEAAEYEAAKRTDLATALRFFRYCG